MKYNFDEVIERRGTDSVKYDAVPGRWLVSTRTKFLRLPSRP